MREVIQMKMGLIQEQTHQSAEMSQDSPITVVNLTP